MLADILDKFKKRITIVRTLHLLYWEKMYTTKKHLSFVNVIVVEGWMLCFWKYQLWGIRSCTDASLLSGRVIHARSEQERNIFRCDLTGRRAMIGYFFDQPGSVIIMFGRTRKSHKHNCSYAIDVCLKYICVCVLITRRRLSF